MIHRSDVAPRRRGSHGDVGEDKAVSVAEAVGPGHFALGIQGLEAGQVAVVRAGDRGEDRKGLGVDVAQLNNILELEFTKQTRET